MVYEQSNDLKTKLRMKKIRTLDVAHFLHEPPGTTASRLNGYIPLTDGTRRQIQTLIDSWDQTQTQSTEAVR